MKTQEQLVRGLTRMLNAKSFSSDEFVAGIKMFSDQFSPILKFIDFTYYNEKRLAELKEQKFREVKSQNFVAAAAWRDKEKECRNYIGLRRISRAKKSKFYYDGKFLCYFYFGNCPNDEAARELYINLITAI